MTLEEFIVSDELNRAIDEADSFYCTNIGDPTGENVEQVKCGCPGARLTSVWECKLHGLCAPLAKVAELKNDKVRACIACPDFIKE